MQSPKSTWLNKIDSISIKNAHFRRQIVFELTPEIKIKLEIDQFLTDLTYYNLFLDSRTVHFNQSINYFVKIKSVKRLKSLNNSYSD